jgi:putative membrane protein
MLQTRIAGVAVLALLAGLPACSQMQDMFGSNDRRETRMSANPGAGPAAARTVSAATRDYVRMAAVGDMFEIESSRLALSESQDLQVQRFARMMIADHSRMSEEMQEAVQEAGLSVSIPTALDAEHQQMMQQLRAASGMQFDRQYLAMQSRAHQQALELHSSYMSSGDQPQLREVATDAVPVIQGHIDQLRTMTGR